MHIRENDAFNNCRSQNDRWSMSVRRQPRLFPVWLHGVCGPQFARENESSRQNSRSMDLRRVLQDRQRSRSDARRLAETDAVSLPGPQTTFLSKIHSNSAHSRLRVGTDIAASSTGICVQGGETNEKHEIKFDL